MTEDTEHPTPDPKATEPDPLDALSTAAKVWTKATRAWPERTARNRAVVVAAFDSGATGREIAARAAPKGSRKPLRRIRCGS